MSAAQQMVKQALTDRNVKLARDLLASEDRQKMTRATIMGVPVYLPLDGTDPLGEPIDHQQRTAFGAFSQKLKARRVKRQQTSIRFKRMLWRYVRLCCLCLVGMLVLCAISIVLEVDGHAILSALGFAGAVREPPVVASCDGRPGAATERLLQIKRDYRQKTKRFHPDKQTQANKDKTTQEFIRLQDTYTAELQKALRDVEIEEQCYLDVWAEVH
jgi:hypothetical protein